MTVGEVLFVYMFVLLAVVAVLGAWHEFRRRRFSPTPSEDHIFRCKGCAYVYTDDTDVARSRCPQCGVVNDVFEF